MREKFEDRISARVAELLAAGERTRIAANPVSHAAIRGWCQAIGLVDARYTQMLGGPDAILIAPPPMLQSWAGAGLASQAADAGRPTLHHDVREAFRAAGFSSVVATNYDQHFRGDLVPGDIVEERSWIEDISPRKSTRLGSGHFVQIGFRFRDRATGRLIGTQVATTFYYVPAHTAPGSSKEAMLPPHLNDPLTIELTPTLVIAGAIASNDYEKVHHDRDAAIADGLPDIILSIITSAGFVLRYLVDYAGYRNPLRSLQLRLGAPACPGDMLVLTSDAIGAEADETVRVRGIARGRLHLEATATFGAHRPS